MVILHPGKSPELQLIPRIHGQRQAGSPNRPTSSSEKGPLAGLNAVWG